MARRRSFQQSRAASPRRFRNPKSQIRNPLSRRLHVEALEDRRLLAVLTVDSPLDNFDPDNPTTDGVVTLREAILAANADATVGDAPAGNGADVIEIDFGSERLETIFLAHGELIVTEAVTIDGLGRGLIIDAQERSRIYNFVTTTGDFSISGMRLTRGKTTGDNAPINDNTFSGGAIRSLTMGILTLDASTVIDNSTTGQFTDGGGVYAVGNVVVNSSLIWDNSNENGNRGGGVFSKGNISTNDSNVLRNSTPIAGGGFFAGGDISVANGSITGNSRGGIHADANVTVTDSLIARNSGSAIFADHVTVRDSFVRYNSAQFGGGIRGRGDVTVTGSTISDNSAESGGGIYIEPSASLTVNSSIISANSATDRGGGIRALGALSVIGSTISGNSAQQLGGGISAHGDVSVSSSTISDNSAERGGGISAEGDNGAGNVTVSYSRLSGNSADAEGGGIFARLVTVTTSSVAGNSAGDRGGGISALGNVMVTSSTLSGNSAGEEGGGIDVSSENTAGIGTIANSTISGNSGGSNSGSGVFTNGSLVIEHSTITSNSSGIATPSFAPGIEVFSSIIAGNIRNDVVVSSGSVNDAITSNGYNIIGGGNAAGSFDQPGDNIIGAGNPGLGPLADNGGRTQTHALLPTSPAIDAGDPTAIGGIEGVPQFDQRGMPFHRVAAGDEPDDLVIDIGAYEHQELGPLTFVVDTLVDDNDGNYSPGDFSLREAIEIANVEPSADTIEFDPALTAGGPATILLTLGELMITEAISINGPGTDVLSIDASGNDPTPDDNNRDGSRVLNIDDGSETTVDVTFSGLRLTGADVLGRGGGIYTLENLTVADSIISENSASYNGGGIYSRGGSLTVTGSTISRNTAEFGAGIDSGDGTLTVADSAISENVAGMAFNTSGGVGGGIYHRDGNVLVMGSTINDNLILGLDSGGGGGILVLGNGNLAVIDSSINGNSTRTEDAHGGGIWFSGGQLDVIGSTISGNSTSAGYSDGGGIFSVGDILNVTESTISGNSTSSGPSPGGGIAMRGGVLNVTRSAISGNVTTGSHSSGGGIAMDGGILNVTDSTISGNYTYGYSPGGGISSNGEVNITNSTVSGNSVGARYFAPRGGGIYIRSENGRLNVTGSTITGNSALPPDDAPSSRGGGIYNRDAVVMLSNSIVANNTAENSPDLAGADSVNYSLIGDTSGSGIDDTTGTGNILNQDPLLGPLTENGGPTQTHALLPGSPAIDAGDPSIEFDENEFDQRGEPFFRVVDGNGDGTAQIDIGAFEASVLFLVDTFADENDDDFSPGDRSLREAIERANSAVGHTVVAFDPALTESGPATILLSMGELVVTNTMMIDGPGAELLTIDASGNDPTPDQANGDGSRVFNIDDAGGNLLDITIGGLALSGGDQDRGGAIYSHENLTVVDSVISGNSAFNGGGGIYSRGNLTVINSTINGNSANAQIASGGGIEFYGEQLSVIGSTIHDNSTAGPLSYGGGIFSSAQVTNISESIISGNAASSGKGGGIANLGGNLTVSASTVSDNNGYSGGGIFSRGNLEITLTTIDSNSAALRGAGVSHRGGDVTVMNSEIINNNLFNSFDQVGVLEGGGIAAGGNLTIIGSVVSGNSAQGTGVAGGGIFGGRVNVIDSTISGNSASGVFPSYGGGIFSGSLNVFGSTIQGNSSKGYNNEGGGISASGEVNITASTVSRNTITGSSGGRPKGGGIVIRRGTLNITDSTIEGNSIEQEFHGYGGAIFIREGTVNVAGSTISGNSVSGFADSYGGGIYNRDGEVNVTTTTISGNSAAKHGGGIFIREGTVNVTGSTISGNSSYYGGGIYSRNGVVNVTATTISGNSAGARGGGIFSGIYSQNGEVNVTTTTISRNSAGNSGGGIFSGIDSGNDNVRLTNSIVANNSAATGSDLTGAASVSYSLIGDTTGSGITDESGIGNILNQDPLLGPLADNGGPTMTHALILGSPAIDAGDPSIDFDENEFDQRGEPFFRVQDGKSPPGRRIDIGAYERQETQPRLFVVDTLRDESDGDFSPGDFSLREAIEISNQNPGPDFIEFDLDLTANGTATITLLFGELSVTDALSIEGLGAALLTIDAAGNDPTPAENNGDGSRVFHINDGDNDNELDVAISGLTLTGGDVSGQGGAIRSLENLVLEQSSISGNATSGDAGYGGGVFMRFGDLTVTGSTLTTNSTGGEFSGGAGIHSRYGDVTVTDTVISGNFTLGRISGGVGVFILGGDLMVTDSTISDNVSNQERSSGGGIFSDEGEVIVTRTTIARNTTLGRNSKGAGMFVDDKLTVIDSTISQNHTAGFDGSGGGIQFFGSAATITGSTISGNFTSGANSPGGAISIGSGAAANLTITSSTITGNSAMAADSAGGGIFASNGDQVTLVHTIVAGNDAVAGPELHRVGATVAVDYSLVGDTTGSGITPTTGTGNILNEDPLLGPLMDNGGPTPTHALLPTSPAIDAGDPSAMAGIDGVPLFDQRGEPFHRVVDGNLPDDIAIDIGAYERQQGETFMFLVDTPVDESDGDFSAGDLALREAIELANLNPGADAIEFDFGHDGPETILLDHGELAVTDALAIDGFDADLLTIDAQQASRIFSIDNPAAPTDTFDVSLSGLTLTGGRTTAANSSAADTTHSGGAIRSAAMVSLVIDEARLTDNHTAGGFAGGGAIFTSGPLTISRSTISGNSTAGDNAKGGGIRAEGDVTLTQVTVHDNHTHGIQAFGGGLYSTGSNTIVRESTISANSTTGADSVGGGLAGVNLSLIDSTVQGNSTAGARANGGGVWAYTASITQSTISGNRAMAAGTLGGGVRTLGDATITRSTITENHADEAGGVFMSSTGQSNLITGSIIAGNTAGTYTDLRPIVPNVVFYSLIGDTTGFSGEEFIVLNNAPGNLLNVDAKLAPLGDNGGRTQTHALLPESPAIDTGDPSIAFNENQFDQRGAPFVRVVDGNLLTDIVIDMGAYESQGIPTYAPGDFNEDGVVGPADYPEWRDGLGTLFTEADYDVWKAHYGDEWRIIPKSASGSSAMRVEKSPASGSDAVRAGERSPVFLFVNRSNANTPESGSLPKSRASDAVSDDDPLLAVALVTAKSNPELPLRSQVPDADDEPKFDTSAHDAWFAQVGSSVLAEL